MTQLARVPNNSLVGVGTGLQTAPTYNHTLPLSLELLEMPDNLNFPST
jgi:hypothetical protein